MSQITRSSLGTGAGTVQTLTGSTGGGAIPPNGAGDIQLTAGAGITCTGAGNAITIAATGALGTTNHAVQVGNALGGVSSLGIGASGTVLTGVTAADPTWTSAITLATGGSLQTSLLAGNTVLIQAYDVDGAVYVPFITLTANDTPTCDLSTDVTIGSAYIYRAGGTDISVADGGTGASTFTDHAVLLGSGAGAITATAVGATGEVFIGNTGADASWSASPTVTTMYATTFDTNVAAAGVTLAGTTLSADGTNADININITAKGAGTVIIDELTLTTDLAVTEGGTGASTLTDHGLLIGSGAAAIDAMSAGTAGQIVTSSGAAADPAWTTATYPATVAIGDVLVASAANTIGVAAGATTSGHVLTANGAGSAPTFQAAAGGGIGTLNGDSGSATGATVTVAGGTNITTSGASATLTVNLDAALVGLTSATFTTGGSVQTGTTGTNTLLIQAYDVDGTTYFPFITLTAADQPTCNLDTSVTIDNKYIYRSAGTDIPVTDGGTGASTLTDHGVLLGSGTGAITATAVGATGEIFVGATGADAAWLAAGDANKVLTAHGAGSAVTWETPSGGGGITWSVITSDQSAAADNGYICNKAGVLTLTLPASCAVGKTIRVTGINTANGWKIAQNAGQTIYWDESNATTAGVTGYLQSVDKYDAVEIVCSVADTSFVVVSSKGNITIA